MVNILYPHKLEVPKPIKNRVPKINIKVFPLQANKRDPNLSIWIYSSSFFSLDKARKNKAMNAPIKAIHW